MTPDPEHATARRMRLLILGGTGFLGRHVAEAALARGHRVTVFNRGRTGPDLLPRAEHLRGDRADDLSALEGRRWDAAVDTSGHLPSAVRRSSRLLADAVEHLTYVSSISAYADLSLPGVAEDAPLAGPPPEEERVEEASYGAFKAACEGEAREALPERTLVVRPGLLVGPYDRSGRFGYWVRRIADGGEVLAPGPAERPVQFLDARDLAAWILDMAEARRTGVFNAAGPARPLALEWLLESCRVEAGSDARIVWVDEAFLLHRGVAPWKELPLWIPGGAGPQAGFFAVDASRAIDAGLRFRPILETVRDVRRWEEERDRDDDADDPVLARDREAELLRAWGGG